MEPEMKATSPGPTYGLIAGLIICIITLIQYLGGVEAYMSPLGLISYAVIFTLAILAGLRQKKLQGGFLEFGQALKTTFIVCVIALLLQTVFIYVLFNFIDVSFKEALSQEIMIKTEEMMKKFGASERQVEEALQREAGADQFALGRVLLGYSISCIITFIICLIISAIIQKKRPAFS